jgi:AcrR family transcriptional regulator
MIRSGSTPRLSAKAAAKVAATRWRRLPEERPAHILSAALECFVEKGFTATRLDDVAQRAGVSKGTLYLYFDSKEALLEAVVRENVVPFVERAERRVDEFQGSSRDLIAELAHGWWDAMYETPLGGLPKLVLSEASNFPGVARIYFDEVVLRIRKVFAQALRHGIERGEFRDVDVDYTVRALMSPFVMGLIWKHSLIKCQIDAIDERRYLDAVLDLVLHGIVKPDRHE